MPTYNEYSFRLLDELLTGEHRFVNTVRFERIPPLDGDIFNQIRRNMRKRVNETGLNCTVEYYVRHNCTGYLVYLGQISLDVWLGEYHWWWSYYTPDGKSHIAKWEEVNNT